MVHVPPPRRSPTDLDNVALLGEMLREAERAIDHQVHAVERLDSKSQQLLNLGVAALAGGLAIATLTTQIPDKATGTLLLFALLLAGLLNILALLFFFEAYVGLRHHPELHVGPQLEWLKAKSLDPYWRPIDHFTSILGDYARYYSWNARQIARSAARRRWGLQALAGGLLLYVAAMSYIVAEAIVG